MKELVDYLSGRLTIENKSMLEKDILLHRVLFKLMNESWFKEEFAFKGGTCIIKCYLGYYRFSEDLDFTYIQQEELANISQKEVRRILSKKINEVLTLLSSVTLELGLDFKKDKANDRYVEIGGSNKFVTFKLWYHSELLNVEQFIKIQINFFELITEIIIEKNALSLYSKIPEKEMKLLFPEYIDILSDVSLKCYSLKEILFEKIRAILTRRGLKSRDFIDVFLIMEKESVHLQKNKKKIIAKIQFMLRYDKYIQNISLFNSKKVMIGAEEKLMLLPLKKGFESFLDEFSMYLKELFDEIKISN